MYGHVNANPTLTFLPILSFHFCAIELSIRSSLKKKNKFKQRKLNKILWPPLLFGMNDISVPGRLLILVAHDQVLLTRRQRGAKTGGGVVECLCLFGNVDQRRLEHLLHVHHRCGLQTTVPHLPNSGPDHWRTEKRLAS